MKYLERLKQRQTETTASEMNKFLVKENNIQFKADLLAIEKSIHNKEKLLEDLLSKDSLNSVDIFNAQDALEKARRDEKSLIKLTEELF